MGSEGGKYMLIVHGQAQKKHHKSSLWTADSTHNWQPDPSLQGVPDLKVGFYQGPVPFHP